MKLIYLVIFKLERVKLARQGIIGRHFNSEYAVFAVSIIEVEMPLTVASKNDVAHWFFNATNLSDNCRTFLMLILRWRRINNLETLSGF